ncbi:galectin-8-like isoform X2 [Sminthopsis crassicaudata]|uniref:galectin-8-like isoform X2 n=2 Tax=Sminthopsis crassicaudata TaxID=9301 RepID=UPI003D687137
MTATVITLYEELKPGKLTIIHGLVCKDADRFLVDFECRYSMKPHADIAFHFCPRFKKSGYIICNTRIMENWGWEEVTYDMPFEKGKPFKIVFMVLKDKFQVEVNGKHLLFYEHRINPDKIDTLGIYGKLKDVSVEFCNIMPSEGNQATSLGTVNMNSSNVQTSAISQFKIPYVGNLSENLRPGNLFIIRGHVPINADRFQVDFQCGSSVTPRADVAFHFNPRFKKSGHIVCNTLIMEKWGWEEITYDMPFEKGKDFQIMFMVLKDKFQVAVNGKHLLLYEYRVKPEKIDTLGIYGKVQIESIEFHSNSVQTSVVSQFTLPYIAQLNSPVKPGQTVVIKGEVEKKQKGSFLIDFIADSTKDIALRLNPQLKAKVFVRNSFLCESWGEEERSITHFPFSPGMYFEMIIYCSTSEYKVAINGVHAFIYKHRFKELDRIDTLKVDGDINLLDIRSW